MTPQQIEALKLALEALEEAWYHVGTFQPTEKAIDLYDEARAAIKEALAEHAMRETHRLGQEIEQEPVAWLLTDKNINSLQVDSIQRLIDRLKHAHHTDLCVRINGQDEWFQADWLKHMAIATPPQRTEPVMILPDGSAFGVMSFPLPDDHWLYAPNEYKDGEYEPIDLPKPILTHELRDAVVAAVRYAVRGATMRGQETDFDPDALVQNAVYALCGPYATPPQRTWVGLTDEEVSEVFGGDIHAEPSGELRFIRAIEAKLKEKNT